MFRYHKKAQSGIELIFLFSLLAFAFSIGYLVFLDKNTEVAKTHIISEATTVSGAVAFEINNAVNQGSGFSKNFTLPATILGNQYNITVNDSLVIVILNSETFISRISIQTINGTVRVGKNMIRNIGGSINVTQP